MRTNHEEKWHPGMHFDLHWRRRRGNAEAFKRRNQRLSGDLPYVLPQPVCEQIREMIAREVMKSIAYALLMPCCDVSEVI
jgi:hypothetical protein